MARPLRKIIEDDRSNWQKAEECLWSLEDMTVSGEASDFRAAAVTFAIFALIEHLQDEKGEQV